MWKDRADNQNMYELVIKQTNVVRDVQKATKMWESSLYRLKYIMYKL